MTVRRALRPRAPPGPRPRPWVIPKLTLSGALQYPPSPCLSGVHRVRLSLCPHSPHFSLPSTPSDSPPRVISTLNPVSTRPPGVPAPLPNRRDWQLPLWAWASDEGASRITACPRRLPCTTSSHPHPRASSNATSVLLRIASGRLSMHRVFASRCAIGVLFVRGPLPFAPQVG